MFIWVWIHRDCYKECALNTIRNLLLKQEVNNSKHVQYSNYSYIRVSTGYGILTIIIITEYIFLTKTFSFPKETE